LPGDFAETEDGTEIVNLFQGMRVWLFAVMMIVKFSENQGWTSSQKHLAFRLFEKPR
jgi:hypothetical protein